MGLSWFEQVWVGLSRFERVLLSFYWNWMGLNGFEKFFMGFNGFLLGFNGFELVWMFFSGFYWVWMGLGESTLGFTGFEFSFFVDLIDSLFDSRRLSQLERFFKENEMEDISPVPAQADLIKSNKMAVHPPKSRDRPSISRASLSFSMHLSISPFRLHFVWFRSASWRFPFAFNIRFESLLQSGCVLKPKIKKKRPPLELNVSDFGIDSGIESGGKKREKTPEGGGGKRNPVKLGNHDEPRSVPSRETR